MPRSLRSRRKVLRAGIAASGAFAAAVAAACGASPSTDARPTDTTPPPSSDRPAAATPDSSAAGASGPATVTRAPAQSVAADLPAPPFDDDEARDLLSRLLNRSRPDETKAVMDHIVQARDMRFIAVFIEMMRLNEVNVLTGPGFPGPTDALRALTGERMILWPEWTVWYTDRDLEPPPGFTQWKGRLYAEIDPKFTRFFEAPDPGRIRSEEIVWGGVKVDGIPALDNPALISAQEADYLDADDLVFGVAVNGDLRAYPLRIMDWHEMANDVVGSVPVSLSYCTLCGAGVLYDGRVGDRTFTFGSSGFLMRSNKLMYDRNTFSLWNQLTGEPVLGPLAAADIRLKTLPVVVTTWGDWTEQHPDSLVLDINTGHKRPYEPGIAYGAYFAHSSPKFPVAERRDALGEKDPVFALRVDGLARAYPIEIVTRESVVNDVLGDTNLVVIASRGALTAEGNAIGAGPVFWNAGAEVRAYQRGRRTFIPSESPDAVLDQQGARWRITEDALESPDGERLMRLPGHLAYWFGWVNYFHNTTIYGVEG